MRNRAIDVSLPNIEQTFDCSQTALKDYPNEANIIFDLEHRLSETWKLGRKAKALRDSSKNRPASFRSTPINQTMVHHPRSAHVVQTPSFTLVHLMFHSLG